MSKMFRLKPKCNEDITRLKSAFGNDLLHLSFVVSTDGSAEASSWFLHVFVALFFVLAHFFTFSWWACTCIQILSLCLSLHMIGSMMCPSKRSDWRFSSCWPESAVFFGTKNWLEELTRSTSTHHFILSFLTLFFTLHHTLQKERKPMPENDSFFISFY